MSRYGDTIYGTRGGPVAAADWGVTTHKDDKIYVHILKWTGPLLALPPLQAKVVGAKEFSSGQPVQFTQNKDGVIVKVPDRTDGEVDRVVVLTMSNGK
jgi:alpha-L-fucosidase